MVDIQLERETLEFLQELKRKFFEEGDVQAISAAMDEPSGWIGVSEAACGPSRPVIPGTWKLLHTSIKTDAVGEGLCMGEGMLTLQKGEQGAARVLRFSALCRRRENGALCVRHAHLSLPWRETGAQADGEVEGYQTLRASLERYQIIAAQTNEIIFDWDLESDQIQYSGGWGKKFGRGSMDCEAGDSMDWMARVHPEDRDILTQLMENIRSGAPYDEGEFRLITATGEYLWFQVRITLQHLEGGKRRGVGVIVDIDAPKRQTQRLRRLAEQDTLTGVYNKGTTQELIMRSLANVVHGELSALFILDVDDFKQVNDRYGHLGGDAVLTDIAGGLKSHFRSEDIIGRIGGDEFCIFLGRVRDREILSKKAGEILNMFHQLLNQGEREGLSCSIGIAVSPDDGEDYLTLFQKADAALYYAKKKGKRQYAFYGDEMDLSGVQERLEEAGHVQARTIESDRGEGFQTGELANYVFRVLYEAEDVDQAVGHLMEILGRQMGVSRTYILEIDEDGRRLHSTFEWCGEGVRTKLHDLRDIDMESVRQSIDILTREGVFTCRNVSALEGMEPLRKLMEERDIRAMLQCAIRRGGKLWGIMGFDECRESRAWARWQVDTLTLVADIVGTFLIRSRAQDRSQRLVQDLAAILDHQKSWIYVIDAESHHLLYANRMARELFPDMELGRPCHQTFFRRESPCELCPLNRLVEEGGTCLVYHEKLGREMQARVNPIPWQADRRAYLLSCLPVEKGEC